MVSVTTTTGLTGLSSHLFFQSEKGSRGGAEGEQTCLVLSAVTRPFQHCVFPIALPCVAFQGFDFADPAQGGRWAIFWLHSPVGAHLSLHTKSDLA